MVVPGGKVRADFLGKWDILIPLPVRKASGNLPVQVVRLLFKPTSKRNDRVIR